MLTRRMAADFTKTVHKLLRDAESLQRKYWLIKGQRDQLRNKLRKLETHLNDTKHENMNLKRKLHINDDERKMKKRKV